MIIAALWWRVAAAKSKALPASDPTPVSKVRELLGILETQLLEDKRVDGKTHGQYLTWFGNENGTVSRTISEASGNIEADQAAIGEEEAKREGYQMSLQQAVAAETVASRDLKAANEQRDKERSTFVKSEEELRVAADQFNRAIEVLRKQAPNDGGSALLQGGGSSEAESSSKHQEQLLAVARQLRDTLEHSSDFSLTEMQRETINGLFRVAASHEQGASIPPASRQSSSEDDTTLTFLQVKAGVNLRAKLHGDAPDVYGEYETQSGSILGTLRTVHQKTTGELQKVRDDETGAQRVFDNLKIQLGGLITNKQAEIANIKLSLSQSEQKSGQLKSQILAAKELLKTSSEEAAELGAEFNVKTANYNERTTKRADELLAVQECLKILSSDEAQKMIAAQFSASTSEESESDTSSQQQQQQQDEQEGAVPSFLATRSQVRRHRSSFQRAYGGYRSLRAADSDDPFAKVKSMIRGMLHKLEEAQAEDVKHAAWCDSELAKSTKELRLRQADVRKLEDRLEEMDARLDELADGLNVTTQEMSEMRAANQKATLLRQQESGHATKALGEYRDAQRILKSALQVMRKFYEAEDNQEGSTASSGFKANGAGTGVIGLLEVALSDYENLEQELSLNEKVAQRDYDSYMASDRTREAVFQKDLEYKQKSKIRLEGDRMRASSDLKSYQKELDAVESYLKELKSSCTIKGDTYDERKDRREKELANLRNALEFLRSENS